ncbi:MAG: PD40 domain-containing protein [Elusimicrobia bacterium]|nr:PD40 domain-containing protein [Elusimicrobiota bacterium]
MRDLSILWTFLFIFLACPQWVYPAAQNKLISKKFEWKVVSTAHFDLYYYTGAEPILDLVQDHLENAYRAVTEKVDIRVSERLPFFLFLNHNDFEQNNIVDVGEGTGGVTEAFKNRFLVFHDGTQRWLEHVIRHEFTHEVQFSVLYAGFWKSARLLKSVLYPLWFMEGMAEYCSDDIDDVQKEMVLRDAVTSKRLIPLAMLHNFNHVKPHEVTLAYKTGNAALELIAREYGKDKVGKILQLIAEKFDIQNALQELLGVNLQQLQEKLRISLEKKYEQEVQALKEPDAYGQALTFPDDLYPVFNSNPAFFPDGKKFVYLSDREGVTELVFYETAFNRSQSLRVQKKFPHLLETISRDGSALSVSPDGRTVLFAGEWHQKDYLYLYDLGRDRLRRVALPLDSISSPQFSPNGKEVAFVGMKNGITDIYLSKINGRHLRQITRTREDENDLRFSPQGSEILFSREIKILKGGEAVYERDLWQISLENGQEKRILSLSGNETQPTLSPDGKEILFASDRKGKWDLYRLDLSSGTCEQVTDVIGGNFNPAFSPDGKNVLFVSYRRVEQHLYLSSYERLISEKDGKQFVARLDSDRLGEFVEKLTKVRHSEPPRSGGEESTASTSSVAQKGQRYRFNASTDFFFPVFFYSSTDGLFFSSYWQASEMLGNHQLRAAVSYASRYNLLNYNLSYSYLKFRPRLILGFLGDSQEDVLVGRQEVRREDAQLVGIEYPLGRFDLWRLSFLTTQRRSQFTDDSLTAVRFVGHENAAVFSFVRDVSRGKYLETTRGYRLILSGEESNARWGSDLDYRNVFGTYHQFLPVVRESVVAGRLFAGAGFGGDRQNFRLGGADILRGYGRFDSRSAASRFVVSNLEYRFPILFDMNTHVWFIFPDFLFKNVFGSIFTDNGLIWDSRDDLNRTTVGDIRNSVGMGLRFQAFVLQTFPVTLQFDWALRTADGEHAFYFGFGPKF